MHQSINLEAIEPPHNFRSQNSAINADRSVPIFLRIDGSKTYKKDLERYCVKLLRELEANAGYYPIIYGLQYRKNLSCLTHIVHSICYVVSRPNTLQVVAVSMDQNQYAKGARLSKFSYSAMRHVVGLLTRSDTGQAQCRLLRGTFNRETNEGVTTRLDPHIRLKDSLALHGLIWPDHPYPYKHRSLPSIQIRYEDGGELFPVERPLTALEDVIPELNRRLSRARITVRFPDHRTYCRTMWDFGSGLPKKTFSGNQLSRQFKYDLDSGGRLYGHFVQGLPSDIRPLLLLNGSEVVEYDYTGMMMHMAYAQLGEECPLPDPYVISDYGVQHREVFKAVFVRIIGSDPDLNLEGSLRHGIHKALGRYPNEEEFAAYTAAFWAAHPSLTKLVGTSAWTSLQKMESEISLRVLTELHEQGILCIPIFDGFVVKETDKSALTAAMRHALNGLSSKPTLRKV